MPSTKYPNQKEFFINKTPTNKNSPFTLRDWEAESYANRDLEDSLIALKMWYYLSAWKSGAEFSLSQAEVEKTFGIKRSSYYKALKILEEKGYIQQIGANCYQFYDNPKNTPEICPKMPPSEPVNSPSNMEFSDNDDV